MLFSPAVCDSCAAVFSTSEVVAEHHGEPASYRASAGPCPRCGSRGSIPRWIFSFHAAAAAARDQAPTGQNAQVLSAVREVLGTPGEAADGTAFLSSLTGTWRGVAAALRGIPRREWGAALAMLCRMLESTVVERRSGADRDISGGVTASAETEIPGAGLSPMSA